MSSLLCPDAFLSPLEIDEVVTRALAEDLGRAGDVTSTATIPETARARAIMVARSAGTIAGLPMVAAAFRKLAGDVELTAHARDGAQVGARTALMEVAGPARAIAARARRHRDFGAFRNMRCAAAAASTTASGSMMRS